jgi:hypothetical protein
MSGFWRHLAERSLGHAEAVRPRLTGRFEPPPGVQRPVEETLEVEAARPAAAQPEPAPRREPATPARAQVPATAPAEESAARPQPPSAEGGPHPALPAEQYGERVEPVVRPAPVAPVAEPGPRPALRHEDDRLLEAKPRPAATQAPAVRTEPPDTRPAAEPVAPASQREPVSEPPQAARSAAIQPVIRPVERAAPATPERTERPAGEQAPAAPGPRVDQPAAGTPPSIPSVQVSIGRVEVRAVFAPPAPPPARGRPAPVMSLDEYLKSRDGGST